MDPIRIVTACKQGLVRSVGLADVLKMHFEPVDVIPVGLNSNSQETLQMLYEWCNFFIIMEERYFDRIPGGVTYKLPTYTLCSWTDEIKEELKKKNAKVLTCEVGQDIYGNSHHPELIDKCWQWARLVQVAMGIKEHQRKI